MYRSTTRGIQITVEPAFMAEQSAPQNGRYFWSYTIEIANLGKRLNAAIISATVTLLVISRSFFVFMCLLYDLLATLSTVGLFVVF